jgi:hypothetical protein
MLLEDKELLVRLVFSLTLAIATSRSGIAESEQGRFASPRRSRCALWQIKPNNKFVFFKSGDNSISRHPFKRTLSTDGDAIYNSLVHPIRPKDLLKQSSSPASSSSSKKPSNPHSSTSFTYDTGSDLINDIDLPNANGAILLNNNDELFSPVKHNSRIS